ncbi:MAG: hypothetical protein H0W74_03150 [Sphingosinicella sp.]|nr:hypothetical protein [Sphingosinicella sp.]
MTKGRWPIVARRTHKWLAALIGIQALIWSVSGLYMTAISIDIIHGDQFVRDGELRPVAAASLIDPMLAARSVTGAESVKLHWLLGRPTYIVASDAGRSLVDASTGLSLPPPTEDQIRQLADHWFTGHEKLASVQLINEVPGEVRGREAPLWRADFEGWNKPTLYFAPSTGELVTRRHELWRVFDFFWMTHIMDYETRDDVNNRLLIFACWLTLAMTLAGIWMLFYAFPRKRRRAQP